MPYTTVASERVFYARRSALSPEAPDLILVHGAGGNHQHWGAAVRNLRSANVYALDLPGHGRSSGNGRTAIADYAAFVVGFMDALGLQKAVIAGHSMGGAIATTMALELPATCGWAGAGGNWCPIARPAQDPGRHPERFRQHR